MVDSPESPQKVLVHIELECGGIDLKICFVLFSFWGASSPGEVSVSQVPTGTSRRCRRTMDRGLSEGPSGWGKWGLVSWRRWVSGGRSDDKGTTG